MDASLSAVGLRKLSRSLTCLARFGETVTLLCLPHELVLTTLSPAKSAHAKVAFSADFFAEWSLLPGAPRRGVTCDLNIKALLGVLRIRSGEKLEACELSLRDNEQMVVPGRGGRSRRHDRKRRRTEGASSDDEADGDEGESELEGGRVEGRKVEQPRFSVQLAFPGFTKNHALQIATPPAHGLPQHESLESTFTAGARDVSEWMEAFPAWGSSAGGGGGGGGAGGGGAAGAAGGGIGAKEEFLSWAFDKDGVRISSWAATARQDQLATAFFVPAEAFENFFLSPTFSASAEREHVLGFPMREFKAVTLLAQSLNLPIHVKFKKPFQPLALSLPSANAPDGDVLAFEFLIMTRDVPAAAAAAAAGGGRRSDAAAPAAAAAPKAERSSGKAAARASDGEPADSPRASGSATGRLMQGARRLRLGPSVEPSGSEASGGGGGGCSQRGRGHEGRHVSDIELPPVGIEDGDERGDGMDYHPPSSAAGRHGDPHAYLTFSHPLAHSTARPRQPSAGKPEPLFYPGSASQQPLSQQARPFASQLTQAELEGLGLGGLDGLDFDMADDEDDEFGNGRRGSDAGPGQEARERPDELLPPRPTQTDAQTEGTQIAQTQVEGYGRAFARFEGGESDEEPDEADVTVAAVEVEEALVIGVVEGQDEEEEETYEMSAEM